MSEPTSARMNHDWNDGYTTGQMRGWREERAAIAIWLEKTMGLERVADFVRRGLHEGLRVEDQRR